MMILLTTKSVSRRDLPELLVNGSTHGVHGMIPMSNLVWSWKTTSACRRTPTDGCAPFTVPTVTGPTLSALHWQAIRWCSYQLAVKVRWRLRRVTPYFYTRVSDRGASPPDRFTGGDFRSVKKVSSQLAPKQTRPTTNSSQIKVAPYTRPATNDRPCNQAPKVKLSLLNEDMK